MGTETLPLRGDDQTVTDAWFNIFRQVLSGDLVPRNINGVPESEAGSLGTSTYPWLSAYAKTLKIVKPGGTVTLDVDSGIAANYSLTFPAALPGATPRPMRVTSGGIITFDQLETDDIEDGAVTYDKLAGLNYASGIELNDVAVTSVSFIDINDGVHTLEATITTVGRPVLVFLTTWNAGAIALQTSSVDPALYVRFLRDASFESPSNKLLCEASAPTTFPENLCWLDFVSAGTHTYKIQARVDHSSNTAIFYKPHLYVVEL